MFSFEIKLLTIYLISYPVTYAGVFGLSYIWGNVHPNVVVSHSSTNDPAGDPIANDITVMMYVRQVPLRGK